MTLREFLTSTQVITKDDDLIKRYLDYRVQINSLSAHRDRPPTNNVGLEYMGASIFHDNKVIVMEVRDSK